MQIKTLYRKAIIIIAYARLRAAACAAFKKLFENA